MLVFLPGYRSDMTGTKATAFYTWAEAEGRACLLLDYSGCGQSEGDFAEATLSRWRARCTWSRVSATMSCLGRLRCG